MPKLTILAISISVLYAFGVDWLASHWYASANPPSIDRYCADYENPATAGSNRGASAEVSPPDALGNEPIANSPSEKEKYDLCQQWRMAEAAQNSVGTSWLQIFIGLGGLGGLIFTVFYAIKSANAAQQSADAAQKQLNILERPYVIMEVQKTETSEDKGGFLPFATTEFKYAFVNYGRSAAVIKEIFVSWPMVARNTMPPKIDPKTSKGVRASVGVVSAIDNPVRLSEWLFRVIDQELLQANAWRKYDLFFIGYVRYQDFFENSYITGFCCRYDPHGFGWVLTGGKAGYNYQTVERKKD